MITVVVYFKVLSFKFLETVFFRKNEKKKQVRKKSIVGRGADIFKIRVLF